MRTNAYVIRKFERLAELVDTIVAEGELNLRLSSEPLEAKGLREDANNMVQGLRGSIKVLQADGGAI